jgi:hypothetical protein
VAAAGGSGAAFWDGVEREIEELDWLDFAEFAGADALAIEARPGFEERLAAELLARFRRRYTS